MLSDIHNKRVRLHSRYEERARHWMPVDMVRYRAGLIMGIAQLGCMSRILEIGRLFVSLIPKMPSPGGLCPNIMKHIIANV